LALSGIQFKIKDKILHKLRKAGATSKANAVTPDEAYLDLQEQCWLSYFARTFLAE
jgi:hypothetical protein